MSWGWRGDRVTVADRVYEEARRLYPEGGSASGRPSFETFCRGPLAAAGEYFARRFDKTLRDTEGSPVGYYMTVSTFFPALGFFAARVGDHIEILDFIVDEDYVDLVGDDPDDG